MGRKTHFTLVELLVVIAIIALLAAMLLPALRNAKLKASGIVCSNKLKTMSTASHFYMNDNNDHFFPSMVNVGGSVVWWVDSGSRSFFTSQYMGLKRWDDIEKQDNPYDCPVNTRGWAGWKYCDYGYNQHPSCYPKSGKYGVVKRSAVRNASQLLLFADAYRTGSDLGATDYQWCTKWDNLYNADGKGMEWCHFNTSSCVFLDSHVEFRKKEMISNANFYSVY